MNANTINLDPSYTPKERDAAINQLRAVTGAELPPKGYVRAPDAVPVLSVKWRHITTFLYRPQDYRPQLRILE